MNRIFTGADQARASATASTAPRLRRQSTRPTAARSAGPVAKKPILGQRPRLAAAVTAALICVPFQSSFAATWWVATNGSDTNPGTTTAPFRTIQKAANVVKAGDTVYVRPGTYVGKVVSSRSGTAQARVRYVSTERWKARITTPTKIDGRTWQTYTHSAGWYNSGDYVDIDGFEVFATMGSGGTLGYGIYTTSSNTRIMNNKVHDISASPCMERGGAGIVADGGAGEQNIEISNNIVYNVGDYAGGCVFVHGVYHTTTGPILNNLTYRISGGGIHLWHAPNKNAIINNTVFNTKTFGIVMGRPRGSGNFDYAVIANNIVYDTKGKGMCAESQIGSHNLFTNNLVYNNKINWSVRGGNTPVNTITADPKFAKYNADGGGDYRLSAASPAINVAAKLYATPFDLQGVQRDAKPDIGAYEYKP